MNTDVLLEQIGAERFRATGTVRFTVSTEGTSREEALRRFQEATTRLLPPTAEEADIDIAPVEPRMVAGIAIPPDDPWGWFCGLAEGDPLWDMYLEQTQLNRQRDDEETSLREEEERAALLQTPLDFDTEPHPHEGNANPAES